LRWGGQTRRGGDFGSRQKGKEKSSGEGNWKKGRDENCIVQQKHSKETGSNTRLRGLKTKTVAITNTRYPMKGGRTNL